MRHITLLILLAAACDRSAAEALAVGLVTAVASCDVAGAVPDDGVDDRAAIQAALDSQGCAHLDAGEYDVDTPQVAPGARRPYAMLTLAGASMYGEGVATLIRFRGSAQGQDWRGIELGGVSAAVRDLSVDTSALTDTDEQTHAVRVTGPATSPQVSRVTFNHPARGMPGGDCVQLVGYDDGRLVTGAWVHDSNFAHCDRSGVAWHSGQVNLLVEDNVFRDTGDQDLDGEGDGANRGIVIRHNTMLTGPTAQSEWAVQIELASDAHVVDNIFDGRGIDLYSCVDCEIGHDQVARRYPGTSPAIAVDKASSRVVIHHSTVVRETSAGTGAVVSATPHGSGTPDHLTVSDSALVQRTAGNVVGATGVVGLYVLRDVVTYEGDPTTYAVSALASPAVRADDVRVEDLSVSGPMLGVLRVSGSYAGTGAFSTRRVSATGPRYGVVCENFTPFVVAGPASSTSDHLPAPVCGPSGWLVVNP